MKTNDAVVRVVVQRKGRIKPSEFFLRPGDVGLSLFRVADSPNAFEILEAVHATGKRGELAVAEITVSQLQQLGLKIVTTAGGTPNDRVNRLHVEARWIWRLRIKMWFQGVSFRDKFNNDIAPLLASAARIVSEESL